MQFMLNANLGDIVSSQLLRILSSSGRNTGIEGVSCQDLKYIGVYSSGSTQRMLYLIYMNLLYRLNQWLPIQYIILIYIYVINFEPIYVEAL